MDADRVIADRYRLRSVLGRGGAGAVWLAHDGRLDRDVAVKEIDLPTALPDDERATLQARVLREARAAARLDAAGTVRVYDVFEDSGRAYLVMELIKAPSLADLVRDEGPLDPQRAARMGLEVLDTLEAAHAAGIVHRDVKPSNVIVPASGPAKLADFGIASVQGDPTLTATGMVLGSPSYLAPEQARDGRAGPAADLWGLGATLYYAVEGVPPFQRDGALATVTAVIHAEPRALQRAGSLAPVIGDLLRKDPAARPGIDQVGARLREVAGGGPRHAPSTGVVDGSAGRRSGRPLGLTLAGVVLVGAVAYAIGGWPTSPPPAEPQNNGRGEVRRAAGQGPERRAAEDPPGQGRDRAAREWRRYTDEAIGYSIAVPADWETVPRGDTLTDFRDPATGNYLRIDWTDAPPADAVAAWEELSGALASSKDDYRELRIEPTTFRGMEAALWEYTYSEGGADLHATNLGFTDGELGMALNFQTRADDWESSRDLYERLVAGFETPDGMGR